MKNKEQQFQKFDSVSLFCSRSKQEVKGFLLAEKHVDVYTENRWANLNLHTKSTGPYVLLPKKTMNTPLFLLNQLATQEYIAKLQKE